MVFARYASTRGDVENVAESVVVSHDVKGVMALLKERADKLKTRGAVMQRARARVARCGIDSEARCGPR